jgi:hypothetical protein
MALIILGATRCALCELVFGEGDDIVATSHFIADKTDPLWKYSDAGIHRRCFLAWGSRATFVEKFNATWGQEIWGNGTRHRMELDGTIVVEQARSLPPGIATYYVVLVITAPPALNQPQLEELLRDAVTIAGCIARDVSPTGLLIEAQETDIPRLKEQLDVALAAAGGKLNSFKLIRP